MGQDTLLGFPARAGGEWETQNTSLGAQAGLGPWCQLAKGLRTRLGKVGSALSVLPASLALAPAVPPWQHPEALYGSANSWMQEQDGAGEGQQAEPGKEQGQRAASYQNVARGAAPRYLCFLPLRY